VIANPPLLAGAAQATPAVVAPADAVTLLGAVGTVAGMTALDAMDEGPTPAPFGAATVKEYEVPFVRPKTEQLNVPRAIHVSPPGEEVARYEVIGEPPSLAGATQLTVAMVFPATATGPVGGPARVIGVTELDGAEGRPVPTRLVAVTVNV
jgi:hypothetical protein